MNLDDITFAEALHVKKMIKISHTLMDMNAKEGSKAILYITSNIIDFYISQSHSSNKSDLVITPPTGECDNLHNHYKWLYMRAIAEWHLRYDYRGC